MIVGIGTDLIEIARIEKACRKQAFLSRIYTEEECRLAGGSISQMCIRDSKCTITQKREENN